MSESKFAQKFSAPLRWLSAHRGVLRARTMFYSDLFWVNKPSQGLALVRNESYQLHPLAGCSAFHRLARWWLLCWYLRLRFSLHCLHFRLQRPGQTHGAGHEFPEILR